MEKIGNQKVWSYQDDCQKAEIVSNQVIRHGNGHKVSSYIELTKKIAELQYLNRDHVLMFRGQLKDHRTSQNNTMMKARIFRNEGRKIPNDKILNRRFRILEDAENYLQDHYIENQLAFRQSISRHRVIRWAILQHYEVCMTPLLDVTHSLRIAASFASLGDEADEAFVFAFGIPNLSGAVTTSFEARLQIVRLSSACPPTAVRPHIQEGYLLGEYPEISDTRQKALYKIYEVDFGRRLVAKFRFRPKDFWHDNDHPCLKKEALYPNDEIDKHLSIMSSIRNKLATQIRCE